MKKQYYVRYYLTNNGKQTFEQFLQAMASVGLRLHTVSTKDIKAREYPFSEFTTIWEIDECGDYDLLGHKINDALESRKFNNK